MGVRTLAINCFPDYVQTDPWWRREMCMSEADATKMLVNEYVVRKALCLAATI